MLSYFLLGYETRFVVVAKGRIKPAVCEFPEKIERYVYVCLGAGQIKSCPARRVQCIISNRGVVLVHVKKYGR